MFIDSEGPLEFHSTPGTARVGIPHFSYVLPIDAVLREAPQASLVVAPPAELVRMLSADELESALVPLVDCLVIPRGKAIPGLGVCSAGTAIAERIVFLRRGDAVQRVAYDPAFSGLAALAAIVLQELQESAPTFVQCDPGDAEAGGCDAALVCGSEPRAWNDAALEGLNLASAWHEATGLPLVHGLWMCRPGAPLPLLRQILGVAMRHAEAPEGVYYTVGAAEMDGVRRIASEASAGGWCPEGARLRLC